MIRLLILIICMLYASCTGSSERGIGKVSIITEGHFDDRGFNESALSGLRGVETNFKIEVVSKESTAAYYQADVESLKDNGSSLIWLMGFQMSELAMPVALSNEDVNYAVIDAIYDKDVLMPPNLAAITFRTEECAFLVGYIAARKTKTGKIGFVGGIKGDIVDSFRFGYEAGALYAKRDIKVVSEYAGSFSDVAIGATMARNMYSGGADIIFAAAGLSGVGVIEAAKELGDGYYVIGVDQDQSYLAPNNIITSAVKDIRRAVMSFTSAYLRTGEFKGGGVTSYGLREGFVGHIRNPKMIPSALEYELNIIKEKIIGGDIKVPAHEESYVNFAISFL
ncbi:BMP family ABC transporter substrate-binding protein (plasmid) [Borrelia turcica IST7]|uniref:BMP family ABC transporter substrate-binding protein n=1 Tax=Borrelia turcica IST7 TaxID=1104446 RepID=A0A386PPW8_9SPIR|nr:BMP family protein [Borrelia turcica]AYE36953.1 BMP family ABC transporter substrate-binding protein [Borrelia turcica IST7]